jgi:hypothetical protein
MTDYADPIVGYYVTGEDGRQDFEVLADAQAAYDALAGAPRAIGRWRQRTSEPMPTMVGTQVVHRPQRARYGDLIEKEG